MGEIRLQVPSEVQEEEARLLLMIKLYETGQLYLGQTAQYAGYSKRTFMELLGKYGVAVIDYPPEDLKHEAEGEHE